MYIESRIVYSLVDFCIGWISTLASISVSSDLKRNSFWGKLGGDDVWLLLIDIHIPLCSVLLLG